MKRFVAHWLADAVRLLCMLAGGLLAMQVPAITHEYAVALLQVAQDARRDIDQRTADARRYYRLAPDADEQAVIQALRPVEPSNAAMLSASVSRAAALAGTHAAITATTPLLQPMAAVWDMIRSPAPDKLAVAQTTVETYVPQVMLQTSAAIYGVAGLMLGGLVGHGLVELIAGRT